MHSPIKVKERNPISYFKVRVHLQEVERLVTLLRVLKARLERTEKMFLRTQETDQKVCFHVREREFIVLKECTRVLDGTLISV